VTPQVIYQVESLGAVRGKAYANNIEHQIAKTIDTELDPIERPIETTNHVKPSATLLKLQQHANRNMHTLSKMIMDEGQADFTQHKSQKQQKINLPSTQEFKQQVLAFKARVQDNTTLEAFAQNNMVSESSSIRKVKPISIDVLGDKKLTLGIRRQSGDSDGNKYLANLHSKMFEDPEHDGKIESFSRAAALEG
jgi:hypothetical protein